MFSEHECLEHAAKCERKARVLTEPASRAAFRETARHWRGLASAARAMTPGVQPSRAQACDRLHFDGLTSRADSAGLGDQAPGGADGIARHQCYQLGRQGH